LGEARGYCDRPAGGRSTKLTGRVPRERQGCLPVRWRAARARRRRGVLTADRALLLATNNMCMDYQRRRATRIAGTPFHRANTPYPRVAAGSSARSSPGMRAPGRRVWQTTERYPVWSGAVVTAGGVVFYGTLDGWFKAADARTGKVLCGSSRIGSGGKPDHVHGLRWQAVRGRLRRHRRRLGSSWRGILVIRAAHRIAVSNLRHDHQFLPIFVRGTGGCELLCPAHGGGF